MTRPKGHEIAYRARKVYRPDGTLLNDGVVRCCDGRIAAVEGAGRLDTDGAGVVDFGDALLLPGLVNAHAHLWLTHLKNRVRRTKDFVAWLGAITWRVKLARKSTLRRSIEKGARELLAGGVTTAVEIDYQGLSAETLADSPLRLVLAREILSLDSSKAARLAADAIEWLTSRGEEPYRRRYGLAPHAPYSVSGELWQALATRLRERSLPSGRATALKSSAANPPAAGPFLTIHIAESAEELRMIVEGGGPFVRRFRRIRFLPRGWRAPGFSPVAYLEQTGILDTPGIAAHCGLVDEADAERLARHGWTVAFCPGTHEYFERGSYPLELLRRAGVPVCVATDSAASNPTGLSLMAEMRRLAKWFPELTGREIVEAATTIPARAIGWDEAIGRIARGRLADFSAWAPCPAGGRLERDWFVRAKPTCVATVLDGRIVRD